LDEKDVKGMDTTCQSVPLIVKSALYEEKKNEPL